MSAKNIRNALGLLQDDPDSDNAWQELRSAIGVDSLRERGELGDVGMPAEEVAKMLEKARRAPETRREFDAVAGLLEIEMMLAKGTPREVDLAASRARVLDEWVLDDAKAVAAYERLLKLKPGAEKAEEVIETSEAKRARWTELVAKYVEEAKKGGTGSFKSSLLVSASEVAFRYGRPQLSSGKKKKQLPTLME